MAEWEIGQRATECHCNCELMATAITGTGTTQDWHVTNQPWTGERLVGLHHFPLNYWQLIGIERRGNLCGHVS